MDDHEERDRRRQIGSKGDRLVFDPARERDAGRDQRGRGEREKRGPDTEDGSAERRPASRLPIPFRAPW